MYTQSWDKYLPVLRILIKKSLDEEQSFILNIPDFEKGKIRKTTPRFSLQFNKGKFNDTIGKPQIAKDLATVLRNDPVIAALFMKHEYLISLNAGYRLNIQNIREELSGDPEPDEAIPE